MFLRFFGKKFEAKTMFYFVIGFGITLFLSASFTDGSYSFTLKRLDKCNMTKDRIDQKNFVAHDWRLTERKGQPHLDISLSVPDQNSSVFHTLLGYKINGGHLTEVFRITNVTCRNPIIFALLKGMSIHYHSNNCTGIQHVYNYKNFPLQLLSNNFKYSTMKPGMYLFQLVLFTKVGLIFCYKSFVNVTQNKRN